MRQSDIEATANGSSPISLDVGTWRLAWTGRTGHAYDEKPFRYLLALERVRGGRSGLSTMLVLVEPRTGRTLDGIGRACAARLFSALSVCVRETDIIGWYRHARIAGVVLTDLAAASAAEVSRIVGARVAARLDWDLPARLGYRMHMRIYRSPRSAASAPSARGMISGEGEWSISA